eukprot:2182199-Prymnesium_polylepis.1
MFCTGVPGDSANVFDSKHRWCVRERACSRSGVTCAGIPSQCSPTSIGRGSATKFGSQALSTAGKRWFLIVQESRGLATV